MEELLGLLGFTTPLIYAGAAYGLFHWLDENASDEAKAELARTMSLKDYRDEQIASALVEVFDRIYTYPLLRWRALLRSLLFTTVVSVVWVYEVTFARHLLVDPKPSLFLIGLLGNFLTDYVCLLVIRPVLVRSGTKPVAGLTLGALVGATIVLSANALRVLVLFFFDVLDVTDNVRRAIDIFMISSLDPRGFFHMLFMWPALAVFVWLPLFALGILTTRLLTPLSWIVGRAQWFLKEGKEHPLKAIGYVAAIVVFLATVAARAVFSA